MTTLPFTFTEKLEKRLDAVKPDNSASEQQYRVCTPATSDSGFRPVCRRIDTVPSDQPLDFSMKKPEQKGESPNAIVPEYAECHSQARPSPIPSTPSPCSSFRYPLSGYSLSPEMPGAPLHYSNGSLPTTPSSIIGHPLTPALPTVLSYAKTSGIMKQKNLRPFKAYRCETVPGGFSYPAMDLAYSSANSSLFGQHDAYLQFKRRLLAQKDQTRKSKLEESCSSQSIRSTPAVSISGEPSRISPAGETTSTPVSRCQAAVVSTTYRKRFRTLPEEMKDESYWERRKKNNEAAKRSRDARRAKEDELAIKTAFLEQDNIRLTVEVNTLRSEIRGLRCMLYSS